MFTRCLVCAAPFEPNEVLERFPHGRRIAYDPRRGRLWVVCRVCKRWSLVPIEERWEVLEDLERLTRDRAKLLSQTDNIALFNAGPLDVVRVGSATLREEAWWRYGQELTARRKQYRKLALAGGVAAGAVALSGLTTGGMTFVATWFIMEHMPDSVADAARWLRFGSSAWRGSARCEGCGYRFRSIPYRERTALGLLPASDAGDLEVVRRCPRCGAYRDGGLHLTGDDAERTLRRVLAYHHFAGATERRVRSATRLIEEAGSARDLTRILVRGGKRIGDLQRTGAIALEIASHETVEQRLLEMELAELEAQWRREEELAAIVDGELTPLPPVERLRRLLGGA